MSERTRTKRLEKKRRDPEDERFERMDQLLNKLEDITTTGRLKDIAYHFNDKREVIKTNLIAGVARGVGLTLGTAIFLALLFFLLQQIVSLPMVGSYIGDLLDAIERYRDVGA
ncbi:hypothetical protein B0H94_102251 [Salsuginibacillus halophilus]|uniref:Uncharacterized protein n=1 Tax=Salsuginibacillus halophilus TaxID=517424 RepID=A0A2P8HXS4_9BACI|nr:DUF5665 domain-containing protein [Salsuginibacillus halophilus]PSL50974.1 hypothetical protein B0H94_102251 [Salsuginibacillus halophilus]